MNEPMIITEKEYQIPDVILDWAQSHSVPVLSCHDSSTLLYDYVIEYSDEITIDYLNMTYCHAHNLPATIATTDRLIIREIGTDDLDIYQRLIEENPAVISDKSLLGLSAEEFKERHLAYMKYSYQFFGYGIWGIFLSDKANDTKSNSAKFIGNNSPNGIMIGIAGLDGTDNISLSYALLEEYWGQGYASSKVRSIVRTRLKVDAMMANVLMLRMKTVWNMRFGQSKAMPAPRATMRRVSSNAWARVRRLLRWKRP